MALPSFLVVAIVCFHLVALCSLHSLTPDHALSCPCSNDGEEQTDIFADLDVSPEIKQDLLTYIKRRLAPQPVKIRADIEVTCFTYEGIDAIKAALGEGEDKGSADCPVKIKLIAPPMYVMTCMTLDKEQGLEIMNQSIEVIANCIRSKG